MTIEQLQFFHAITEYDTFLEAADSLHVSQSTLSKQLKRLEEELGVTLIDRSRRSASLTEAGERFAEDVQLILMQYQLTMGHLEPYRRSNSLRIGTLPVLGQYGLTEKLAQFAASHPAQNITVEDVEENELFDGFVRGHFDAVICRELTSTFPQASWATIAEDELVAVLPEKHPLAEGSVLPIKKLSGQSLLLMNTYTSIYKLCIHIFKQNEVMPADIQTSRMETMISRIQAGNRIALMPYQNFRLFRQKQLIALPLSPTVSLPVLLILRPGKEKGIGGELLQFLRRSSI